MAWLQIDQGGARILIGYGLGSDEAPGAWRCYHPGRRYTALLRPGLDFPRAAVATPVPGVPCNLQLYSGSSSPLSAGRAVGSDGRPGRKPSRSDIGVRRPARPLTLEV